MRDGGGVDEEQGCFRSRFGNMRQEAYIMIKVCSHDHKNSMGDVYACERGAVLWIYSMVIPSLLQMITTRGSI